MYQSSVSLVYELAAGHLTHVSPLRYNLNGSCVRYDMSTGICSSDTTQIQGVYVANNENGRCDSKLGVEL